MKIYLAHGKNERNKGKKIQAEIEQLGIEVYNPFYSVDRKDISKLDSGLISENKVKVDAMIVVDTDLEAIRKSDMVVCIYPEKDVTIGVPCEMMYASILNMPIITVASEELLEHPWIVALSDGLFYKLDDLYLYLHALSKLGDEDDGNDIITDLVEKENPKKSKKK